MALFNIDFFIRDHTPHRIWVENKIIGYLVDRAGGEPKQTIKKHYGVQITTITVCNENLASGLVPSGVAARAERRGRQSMAGARPDAQTSRRPAPATPNTRPARASQPSFNVYTSDTENS